MQSPRFSIAVLGTGGVGAALGTRWAQLGHHVLFGSRDPQGEKARKVVEHSGAQSRLCNWSDAVEAAEVVLVAVPWRNAIETLQACGPLAGKVVIDCTNPLTADIKGLMLGHTTSAAEEIAAAVPAARVVKAFNTVGVKTMLNPRYNDEAATLFYCGDDPASKTIVRQLAAELGFEPADSGPLRIARYLEPLAMLYIHLAVHEGWGSKLAFKLLRRA